MSGWVGSGLEGGGFINVVRVNPYSPDIVLQGGDVAGIYRTGDAGDNWNPVNDYATSQNHLKVADIQWGVDTNTVYALVGNGTGGGFIKSTDGGQNWAFETTANVIGNGGDPTDIPGWPAGLEHPRSVDQLLAVDTVNGFIYAGSYKNGLYRASLSNTTAWTKLCSTTFVSPNQYIRSVILDSSDPTTVYISVYQATGGTGQVYRLVNANTATSASTPTRFTNSPVNVEGMFSVSGRLLAMAQDGLYKLGSSATAAAAAAWTQETGVPFSTAKWKCITGYTSGGVTTIYCGNTNPQLTATNTYAPVFKGTSSNAFSTAGTWVAMPAAYSASVHNSINNTGRQWWTINARSAYAYAKNTFVASGISIDLNSAGDNLYVSGRSGTWKTTNPASGGTADWYPVVRFYGGTINRPLIIDPNNHLVVMGANTDYSMTLTQDGGNTYEVTTTAQQPGNMGSAGYSIAVDSGTVTAGNSKVFLSTAVRGGTSGGVLHSILDPTNFATMPGSWTDEGLDTQAALATGGHVATGMIVVRDATNVPWLICAVYNKGLVRKNLSTGVWSAPTSTPTGVVLLNQNTLNADFTWKPGQQNVYLYDRDNGVWRGSNYGASWTRILAAASDTESTGYVDYDPSNPSILYVSNANGVYKLTNADTATQDAGTLVSIDPTGIFSAPGALTVDKTHGIIYCINRGSGGSARIYRATTAAPTTWVDISDALFQNQAIFAFDVQVDETTQGVYASLNGDGVVIYTPPPAGAGTGFVQDVATLAPTSGASASTDTLTVGVTVPVDDHLIVGAAASGAAVLTSITDSKGNVYQIDATGSNGTGNGLSCASAHITTQLVSGDTITLHWSTATTQRAALVRQYHGLLTSGWLHDISVTDWGTGTGPTTLTAALGTDDIAIGFFEAGGGITRPTWTDGPSNTNGRTVTSTNGTNSGRDLRMNDWVFSNNAPGSISLLETLSISEAWVGFVGTYRTVGSPVTYNISVNVAAAATPKTARQAQIAAHIAAGAIAGLQRKGLVTVVKASLAATNPIINWVLRIVDTKLDPKNSIKIEGGENMVRLTPGPR